MHDYVVVGAGSAGCVLAARLTEDPGTTVLLLEAGGRDDAEEVRIPLAFSRLFRTRHDWAFMTAPQQHAQGRSLYWPRGKVLGGSSSINAMIYIRGNRLDYDAWRDDFGCTGWGYADLLPYFCRSEDQARARRRTTAWADPCGSRTAGMRIGCPARSSTPPRPGACPAPMTSTRRRRRGSAATR